MGSVTYGDDADGVLLPITVCKESYKKRSVEPSSGVFEIDTELETG